MASPRYFPLLCVQTKALSSWNNNRKRNTHRAYAMSESIQNRISLQIRRHTHTQQYISHPINFLISLAPHTKQQTHNYFEYEEDFIFSVFPLPALVFISYYFIFHCNFLVPSTIAHKVPLIKSYCHICLRFVCYMNLCVCVCVCVGD